MDLDPETIENTQANQNLKLASDALAKSVSLNRQDQRKVVETTRALFKKHFQGNNNNQGLKDILKGTLQFFSKNPHKIKSFNQTLTNSFNLFIEKSESNKENQQAGSATQFLDCLNEVDQQKKSVTFTDDEPQIATWKTWRHTDVESLPDKPLS